MSVINICCRCQRWALYLHRHNNRIQSKRMNCCQVLHKTKTSFWTWLPNCYCTFWNRQWSFKKFWKPVLFFQICPEDEHANQLAASCAFEIHRCEPQVGLQHPVICAAGTRLLLLRRASPCSLHSYLTVRKTLHVTDFCTFVSSQRDLETKTQLCTVGFCGGVGCVYIRSVSGFCSSLVE